MTLSIIRGKKYGPKRTTITGPIGVGKSTLACKAEPGGTPHPKVVALSWERGRLNHIGPARVDGGETWGVCMAQVRELCIGKGDHDTVVIDTADALEAIAIAQACIDGNKKTFSDFNYADGYVAAAIRWRELLKELDGGIAAGRAIHIVAHISVKEVKDPTMPKDYHKNVGALTKYNWLETSRWCDNLLYVDYDKGMVDGRAVLTGDRLIHTVAGTGYDAKHSPNIRSPIKLSWAAYERECKRLEREPKAILAAIRALSEAAGAAVDKTKFEASLALAGEDVEKLVRIEIKLEEKAKELST